MVDFRRCITALAVLALFAGLAVAQTTPGQQLTCNTNVTVTPNLRSEGYTEQTGDITITCTGGQAPVVGLPIPQVNITVFYNTQVTSRLFSTSPNVSEALLLIDEPGSGLTTPLVAGFGPGAPQNLCTTPLSGCAEIVGSALSTAPSIPNVPAGTPVPVAVDPVVPPAVQTTIPGRNVFQGVVSGSSVTFFGIPVLAPGSTSARVFRITNVRVNAITAGGGSASGAGSVQASISISPGNSLSIQNSNPNVGFVTSGLTGTVSGSTPLNQCTTQTKSSITTLKFAENFGTAFKTRVAATATTTGQASSPVPAQNAPGVIYNSESGLILAANGGGTAGLADFGTRLKATFGSIPAGVRVFVSTSNVLNNNLVAPAPAPIGGVSTSSYAQLVNGESSVDGSTGFFPAVTSTDNGPNNGNVPIAEITITNGTGQAVWEVVNTNPNANETFNFAVFVTFSANVTQNSPPPGTSTVNLSFAPTPPSFTASAGGVASSTLPIPRFIPDPSAARNVLTVQLCRTILLYPYVTNQAGFDTGLSIANTSVDPFTNGSNVTAAQSGTCTLNWFGGTTTAPTTAPAFSTVGPINGGNIYVNTAQSLVPGFQGYMIAVCNFQYAHGFAFISDVGARNLAMGYLAVVLTDPGTSARSNTNTTTSENGGN